MYQRLYVDCFRWEDLQLEDRLWSRLPQKPLEVSFNTKISLPSVNNHGRVDNLNVLKQWKAETTIETILVALKNEMVANKSKKQPAEGEMY